MPMNTNSYLRVSSIVAVLAAAMLVTPRALAAPSAVTFTVDTTLDLIDPDTSDGVCPVGSCSLRAAIMQANVITGPGVTINLPSGTYTLTRPPAGANGDNNGDLNLMAPPSGNPVISIVGAGAASTIIDANKIDRVFSVASGRTATLSGVTIRNGFRLGASGGGVFNGGNLTISDSVIEGNQTDAAGGGIRTEGVMNITRTTIRSNVAFRGGGLRLLGITTIRDSSIYGNGADFGGGIAVGAFSFASQLTIVNSTISQNYANTNGGGIDSEGDTFLYNTSVIDNDAYHDRNSPTGGKGGGVYVNAGSRFVVVNTLIARNTLNSATIPEDCSGTLEGYGWNLLGDLGGCTFTGNGNGSRSIISLSTLGPLQDNGGPTLTHALLAGSTAIDSTFLQGCVNETGATLTTDQRGVARGTGFKCDVGAFEYSAQLPLVATLDVDASISATKYDSLTDGLLTIRYLFGLTGASLIGNAIGATATRKDAAAIKTYLDAIRASLDIDGNGSVDALTDGLLVIRYLFGLRGTSLMQGAIAAGATRITAAQIESYIATLTP